jgi:hypothetical protein
MVMRDYMMIWHSVGKMGLLEIEVSRYPMH